MQNPQQRWDTVILGAGAAGLMCAAEAGKRGRSVLLLEHGERAGRKILISGGGRCNFTNLDSKPANFLSENPHFAKSALSRYTPQDFVALVEKHRIPYHHKTLGQLFCDGSAQAIVTMLEAECREARVVVQGRTAVERVSRNADGFAVHTSAGVRLARTVVVATGGLSIPKMGATGIGYDIARAFGLRMVEPRAALVPLTLAGDALEHWAAIAGVSAEVTATVIPATKRRASAPIFREKLLFTHRGLSGPAVLQASSYREPGDSVRLDLAPGQQVFTPLLAPGARRDEASTSALLRAHVSQRLSDRWLRANAPPDWKNRSLEQMEATLHAWTLPIAGDEGFSKAEVTRGGVSTSDLDSTTMQARGVPGLAFIGEVVDVTGHLGGHNFQWAWASAVAAAAAL
ncbi:NAD(P)/FAD-dependent oxidoreductase [Terriglobus sp.]|uniref:NAD(P)/FAD-dependent oxidoreductase n=1 Tax=Terriglobus sp. TaxID=1889013 RepID=UPI003B0091B2